MLQPADFVVERDAHKIVNLTTREHTAQYAETYGTECASESASL